MSCDEVDCHLEGCRTRSQKKRVSTKQQNQKHETKRVGKKRGKKAEPEQEYINTNLEKVQKMKEELKNSKNLSLEQRQLEANKISSL